MMKPDSALGDKQRFSRIFLFLLAAWGVFWTVLPLISLDNDFIDILENIVWGRHFQWGYDKNPYFGAWLGHGFYVLTGGGLWINYLLSQIFVCTGLFCIWRLANRFVTPARALISTLALTLITFYGMKATELCDDVMELGLWPLTILFFYRALCDGNRLRDWLLTGLFAGLSFMTKYYAFVLFLPMLSVLLFTERGRRSFRHAGVYCAAALFAVISLPNMIWLIGNRFVAIDYAFERAAVGGGGGSLLNHFKYPWRSISRAAGVVIVPIALLAAVFFRREKTAAEVENTNDSERAFQLFFLTVICWGPYALTLLFSLLTGGKINYSWVLPCFSLLPLYAVYLYRPVVTEQRLRLFLGVVVLFALIFGGVFLVRSVYHQPYRKKGCDYENYPGKAVAAFLSSEWRKLYGTSLPYVIGERRESCNIAVYSPDQPEAYFSARKQYSQWIDERDILRRGGVVVWDAKEGLPSSLKRILVPGEGDLRFRLSEERTADFFRAAPGWFRSLMKREPKSFRIVYRFIEPETGARRLPASAGD